MCPSCGSPICNPTWRRPRSPLSVYDRRVFLFATSTRAEPLSARSSALLGREVLQLMSYLQTTGRFDRGLVGELRYDCRTPETIASGSRIPRLAADNPRAVNSGNL